MIVSQFLNGFPERGEAPQFRTEPAEALPEVPAENTGAEEKGFSFWDLLDVVNPLQHIPVISTLYRHITGDEIGAPAQLAGGFIYGGPLGLASSAINVGVAEATGDDLGGHIMSIFEDSAADGAAVGSGDATEPFQHASAARAYGRGSDVGPGSLFDGYIGGSP